MIVLENRKRKASSRRGKAARKGPKRRARKPLSYLARTLVLSPAKGRKIRAKLYRNPGSSSVLLANRKRRKKVKRRSLRDAKGRFLKKGLRKAARKPVRHVRKAAAHKKSARGYKFYGGKKAITAFRPRKGKGITVAMKNRRRSARRNDGSNLRDLWNAPRPRPRYARRRPVSPGGATMGPLGQYQATHKRPPRARMHGPALPKRWYRPSARAAALEGMTPRELSFALQDLNHEQLIAQFPDFESYLRFYQKMMKDPTFRAWARSAKAHSMKKKTRKVARKARKHPRKGVRKAAKRKTAKRKVGKGRRRNSKGRFVKATRNAARRRRHGRRRHSVAASPRRRRRVVRVHARRRHHSRRARRNGSRFIPNFAFMSLKEMLFAGGIAFGSYMLINAVSGYAAKSKPMYGTLAGLALGGLAVWKSDKLFSTDSYAKGVAFAGLLALAGSAISYFKSAKLGAAGFGSLPSRWMVRYAHNPFAGPFLQAQAGFGAPFQQALAAPFYQAQAGFGEYIGTGEYVSSNGTLAAVSDMGEYVAQNLSVEGYSDYEVQPQYAVGADGFGYVNEGVHPGANMDHEFNIIEAAAGLGAGPSAGNRSDYIPTVQSGNVGGQESPAEAGIFDVGGSNGVFG